MSMKMIILFFLSAWGIFYLMQIIINILKYIFFRRAYFPDNSMLRGKSMALLRCPFCGQDKVEMFKDTTDDGKEIYAMECDIENGGCGASTGWYDNEIDAVSMWNTRDGEPQESWKDINEDD